MKKAGRVLLVATAAFAFGAAAPAGAAPRSEARSVVTSVNPYAGLLQRYPRGGEGLVEQTERSCESCDTAKAVIALASQANPDQKAAIALGVLRALKALQAANPDVARCIRQALRDADPTLVAMVNALESQLYAQNGGYGHGNPFYPGSGGGFSGGGVGGGVIISPTR